MLLIKSFFALLALMSEFRVDMKAPQNDDSVPPKLGILRVHGPDQKGIVAAFSQLL